jgi:hypothetical protein
MHSTDNNYYGFGKPTAPQVDCSNPCATLSPKAIIKYYDIGSINLTP